MDAAQLPKKRGTRCYGKVKNVKTALPSLTIRPEEDYRYNDCAVERTSEWLGAILVVALELYLELSNVQEIHDSNSSK